MSNICEDAFDFNILSANVRTDESGPPVRTYGTTLFSRNLVKISATNRELSLDLSCGRSHGIDLSMVKIALPNTTRCNGTAETRSRRRQEEETLKHDVEDDVQR